MRVPDKAEFIAWLRHDGCRQLIRVAGGNTPAQTRRRLEMHLAEKETETSGVVCVLPAGEKPGQDDPRWERFIGGITHG
jgi:hypothetical protein